MGEDVAHGARSVCECASVRECSTHETGLVNTRPCPFALPACQTQDLRPKLSRMEHPNALDHNTQGTARQGRYRKHPSSLSLHNHRQELAQKLPRVSATHPDPCSRVPRVVHSHCTFARGTRLQIAPCQQPILAGLLDLTAAIKSHRDSVSERHAVPSWLSTHVQLQRRWLDQANGAGPRTMEPAPPHTLSVRFGLRHNLAGQVL